MGTWNDLPNELAIMVLHWLDRQEPMKQRNNPRVNQNILQCTYVSRQFRDIVEPILYREVKIRAEYSGDDPFPQLRHLARTISSRPELGACVQKLDASGLAVSERIGEPPDGYDDADWCRRNYSLEDLEVYLKRGPDNTRSDKRVLLDAIARLGLPNGLIVEGGSIGEFFLLLHLLHRLQELQMGMTDDMAVIAAASMGAFAGGVPVGMQSISKLSIFCEDIEVNTPFHKEGC